MKNLTFILAAAMALVSQAAFAQDDPMLFNHVALGISGGLDGAGINVALPVGNHVGIRAGYSMLPEGMLEVERNVEINESISLNTRDLDLETVAFKIGTQMSSGNVLVDLFPGKKSGFHFTVGGYYSFNTKFINITADMRKDPVSGKEYLRPDEYGHVFYSDPEKGLNRVTTDLDGFAHADFNVGTFMPYVGLGFGRGVRSDKRVSLLFDLGMLYAGDNLNVTTYDIDQQPVKITSDSVENKDEGLIDKVLSGMLPMVKLSLFVKLF